MAIGRRARPPRRRRGEGLLGPLLRGLGGLLLVLVCAGGGLLWATLPAAETELRLPGLAGPVSILLDGAGVPRIRAGSERDATMALGWLHARDRMFQMELMRRGVAGRLAELAGPAVLRNDRFVRLLDLAGRARADLAALPAETRDLLEAYSAGVNAWIEAQGRFAAPEFLALGAPEPWRPEHCLYWGKLMGLWLSGDWRTELDRARLSSVLSADRVDALWPAATAAEPAARREEAPAAAPPRFGALPADPTAAGHLARLAAAIPRFPEPGTLPGSASNAWVLAGGRATGGAPMLASDPHLGFTAPILWYLARIDLPGGRMLAGATSPGVPFFLIGRNERIAWGFTTTHADTQDLFQERLVGPDRYETPDGPRPFTRREEVIAVRGAAAETLVVRESRHGPLLSDLDIVAPPGIALAVAMANLAPEDSAAAGLLALNRARTLAEARAAAALITGVSQNLLVADAAGPLGLFITGRIPRRAGGDGSRPAPGWDGSAEWTGWVPFEDLPHQENPPSGLLANANNRVLPSAENPAFLGRDWPGDARYRRILELLPGGRRFSAEELAAVQTDVVSLLARDLLRPSDNLFRRMEALPGAAGTARELLLAWDGAMRPALAQPLIFNAWARRFHALALAAGGVPEGAWHGAQAEFIGWLLGPDGRPDPWCGDDCTALAARALTEAVAELVPSEGPDPAAWSWARVHVARLEHPILRFIPGLQAMFRLQAVTPGDDETISRGGIAGRGANPYAHVHGAGLRLVADLADPERTLAVIATGQSGHPLSAHWGDLLPLWRDGRMLRLGRVPMQTMGQITLNP